MPTIFDLLKMAKERGASDLHVTVGIPPKIRVNGELISLELEKLLPQDIKELAQPLLTEHVQEKFKRDGECDFAYAVQGLGRFRVNLFHQRGSYALAIRLVGMEIPKPEDLGIPEIVVEVTKKRRGLVLVTGPTGSGKSTTLASLIDIINTNNNAHIITLEDPIEYLHNHKQSIVNQREVGLDTTSYAQALKSALREDPDVILVGEMRDLETIATAITAAETGHLVFSTLHTIGAPSTIDRIIDVFPPYQQQQIRIQLASVLEMIVSQQLLPTAENDGRVAAFEVLCATASVRNQIRESKTHQLITTMQTARKQGMITMDDALYELYVSHRIDAEHTLEYAVDATGMAKKMY